MNLSKSWSSPTCIPNLGKIRWKLPHLSRSQAKIIVKMVDKLAIFNFVLPIFEVVQDLVLTNMYTKFRENPARICRNPIIRHRTDKLPHCTFTRCRSMSDQSSCDLAAWGYLWATWWLIALIHLTFFTRSRPIHYDISRWIKQW